jgi:glycopeptide antibiotics resistance protein
MYTAWLISYVGVALLYAAVATLGVAGVGRMLGSRRVAQAWPTAFAVLFFVILTQHPFPDPATLDCPVRHTEPQLVPFDVVQRVAHRWSRVSSNIRWLLRPWLLAPLMNLVLCAFIGALLARHRMLPRTAVLSGFGLSLAVELTQLTGIWGLYPCPYRQFDVDDLILNTAGVALGFVLVRGWRGAGRAKAFGAAERSE